VELDFDISYMPIPHTGHLIPQKSITTALKNIYSNQSFESILEFGFNTGWSSAIFLTLFSNVKITSVEILKNTNSKKGAEILKNKFANRHKILWQDSNDLCKKVLNKEIEMPDRYDTSFIDGGHDSSTICSDIKLSLYLGIKNFIFDDGDTIEAQKCIKKFNLKRISCYLYKPYIKKHKEYKLRNKKRSVPVGLHHYKYES